MHTDVARIENSNTHRRTHNAQAFHVGPYFRARSEQNMYYNLAAFAYTHIPIPAAATVNATTAFGKAPLKCRADSTTSTLLLPTSVCHPTETTAKPPSRSHSSAAVRMVCYVLSDRRSRPETLSAVLYMWTRLCCHDGHDDHRLRRAAACLQKYVYIYMLG